MHRYPFHHCFAVILQFQSCFKSLLNTSKVCQYSGKIRGTWQHLDSRGSFNKLSYYHYTLSRTSMVNEVERKELSWSSSVFFLNKKVRITWTKMNSKAIIFSVFKWLNFNHRIPASINVKNWNAVDDIFILQRIQRKYL